MEGLNPKKEKLLSSIQYATGWLLFILFIWGFVLPFFIEMPSSSVFFPTFMVTFFTHAAVGIRSTAIRYRVWRPWVDLAFLVVWIFSCSVFVLIYL
ncbi:MAG TPA: hypothetical protein ENI09_01405 [candidate division WWE3 bacterium]|uniref:Uncharacterized protein n=1 Tax=candidate division WWE3 bacterium TaxID=2053526 RepID=A0A7C1NT62_UNCKA|nr:hypothetical protein [candidate division WWE3 bacterium]